MSDVGIRGNLQVTWANCKRGSEGVARVKILFFTSILFFNFYTCDGQIWYEITLSFISIQSIRIFQTSLFWGRILCIKS